MIYKKRNSLH